MSDLHKYRDALRRRHVVTLAGSDADGFARVKFACPSSWSCEHSAQPFAMVSPSEISPLRETDLESQFLDAAHKDTLSKCELCSKPIVLAKTPGGGLVELDYFAMPGGAWRLGGESARNVGTQVGERGEALLGYVAHADTCAGKAAVAS